jgi:hypothetical protein
MAFYLSLYRKNILLVIALFITVLECKPQAIINPQKSTKHAI